MKSVFLLVLSVLLLLSLAGCAPEPADEDVMTADVAERLGRTGREVSIRSLEVI